MMRWCRKNKRVFRRCALLVILALLVAPERFIYHCPAATDAELDPDLNRALRDLGDERFDVREKASATLFAAGIAAEPALRKAATGDDPEVRVRAQRILDSLAHGIFPDTPAEIVDLATRYSSADQSEKMKILYELAGRGGNGCVVLMKLAEDEHDAVLKTQIARLISGQAPRIPETAAVLLAAGDNQRAQRLLATAATTGEEIATRSYGALLLANDNLPATIAQLQNRADGDAVEAIKLSRTLAYLHRAAGDLEHAAAAAEKGNDRATGISIALERRDWKKLADLLTVSLKTTPNDLRELGLLATAQRLAGDQAAVKKTLARVSEVIQAERDNSWLPVSIFVINDQLGSAIDLLVSRKNYVSAFNFYCYSGRFDEALALAELGKTQKHPDSARLAALAARLRWQLGEKESALAALSALATENAAAADKNSFNVWTYLCDAEREIGRSEPSVGEKVKAHALAALGSAGANDSPGPLFEAVFPGGGAGAAQWWEILKQIAPADSAETRFDKLSAIVDRTIAPQELEAMAQVAAAKARLGPPENYPSRRRLLQLLADTLKAAQRPAAADIYFDQLSMLNEFHGEWMEVAHRAAEKKDWTRAADYYARAGSTAETVWLHGWALQQSGKDGQGHEMMRRGQTLALGDERQIATLAADMESRGLTEQANQERQRLERLGTPRTWFYYNNCRLLGIAAANRDDSRTAADYWQVFILGALDGAGPFTNEMAFVQIPQLIHQHRGRGYLQAGRVEDALREFAMVIDAAPVQVQLAIDVAPELKKLGHAEAARQLFDFSYKKLQGFCDKYPGSAHFHNAIAWLCIKCGYESETALVHAQRAVELLPSDTDSLDTLAEIQFHRGDRAKAIELMRRCERLQPREARHRERREAFEKREIKD